MIISEKHLVLQQADERVLSSFVMVQIYQPSISGFMFTVLVSKARLHHLVI